ncbi:MAG: phosphoribosyltransferase family protein [Candidatus Nitrosotenuis sp.]
MSFKEFLAEQLNEHLYVDKNNKIQFSPTDVMPKEYLDIIKTGFKNTLRLNHENWPEEDGKDALVQSYYLCGYKSTSITKDLLRVLKGGQPKDNNITIDRDQYEKFIEYVADVLAIWLPKELKLIEPKKRRSKPTYIVCPRSSSNFLRNLTAKLRPKLGNQITIVDDLFVKRIVDHENEHDVDSLINKEHPDWNTLDDKQKAIVRRQVIDSIKNSGNNTLSIKRLQGRNRKFVKGFMDMKDTDALDYLRGEVVYILDDINSTGSTMQDIVRLLKLCEPTEIVGITIFKNLSKTNDDREFERAKRVASDLARTT